MKDLPQIRGREYIARLVAEGEHQYQDFKYVIPDARKIARSVSAFANAGGGRLLIGVKDNGVIAGVREGEEDIYVVEQAGRRYCDPPQQVEFTAFRVDTGVVVIRASIAQAASRPVRCQEPDGQWRAYYRVADENIAAHPLMVRAWQLRGDDSAPALNIDADASALIALVRESGETGLLPADTARALGISMRRAEQIIVELAAAGILDFVYRHPDFRLTLV